MHTYWRKQLCKCVCRKFRETKRLQQAVRHCWRESERGQNSHTVSKSCRRAPVDAGRHRTSAVFQNTESDISGTLRTCTAAASRWPQCGARCGTNFMAGTGTGRATQDAAASPRPNTTVGPAGSAPGCEGGMLLPASFALVALCPVVRACLSARGHVTRVRDAAESVSAPEGAPERSRRPLAVGGQGWCARCGLTLPCLVTSQNSIL